MTGTTTLRRFALIIGLLAGRGVQAAPARMLQTDFGQPDKASATQPSTQSNGESALPEGWKNDPARAKSSDAHFESAREGDRKFLRIERKTGRFQIIHTMEDTSPQESFYSLSLEMRSPLRAPVTVAIAEIGTPKKVLWTKQFDTNEVWGEAKETFRMPAHQGKISIVLWSWGDRTDIGKLNLSRESTTDLIDRLKQQSPHGGDPVNLLGNTRFPLGIQSGWGITRDLDDDQMSIVTDKTLRGPSGAPSLKIHSVSPMTSEVTPFDVPWSFQPHVASLYARGTGTLRVVVLGDAKEIAGANATLKPDEWTRVVVPFQPVLLGMYHQLQLASNGDVWIDAMQVEPGSEARPYAPAMQCEVALGWPKSDASAARIQFDDEKPLMDWAITGAPAQARLAVRVVNLYGDSRELRGPLLEANASKELNGQVRYDVFPDRPLGPQRVEAWVEDSDGKRISPFAEAIVTRLRRPHFWGKDGPESHFGGHMNFIARQLTMAKAVGINWTRLHDAGSGFICWSFLETEKGKWTFFDAPLKKYHDGHISILGMLGQAPGWASTVGRPATEYWDRWVQPSDLDGWQNYVKTVTTRYRGLIDVWDTWNEPWGRWWLKWDPKTNASAPRVQSQAAKDFAELQKISFDATKAVDPKLQLAGINTFSAGSNWSEPLFKEGAAATCDIFDYHHYNSEYNGFPDDAVERGFHDAFDSAGKFTQPVWMTEGNGANRMIERGFYHYTLPETVGQEDAVRSADLNTRYVVRLLTVGVDKVFLYHMNVGGEFRPEPGAYQSLVTDDGFVHPQGAALSEAAFELDKKHFVKHLPLGNGIHAYLFEGEGDHAVAAILSEFKYGDYTLPRPAEGATRDLFGNDLPVGAKFTGTAVYVSTKMGIKDLEEMMKGSSK